MKDIIKGCIAEIEADIIRFENSTFLSEDAKDENIERLKDQLNGLVDSNPGEDKGEYTIKAK